ncbi:MAG: alpha/beta hydrolase [Cyanobacteria bacterium P01_C01_bin.120]
MPSKFVFAAGVARRLKRLGVASGVLLGAGAIALMPLTNAQALEKVRLLTRFGGWPDLTVAELDEFANTSRPPQNVKRLINLVAFFTDVDEASAHEYLTSETPVNREYLLEASYTPVGERFYRLASNAMTVTEDPDRTWIYLRDAMLAASDEEVASAIELIREIDANTLEIDTEKLKETSEQIERDEEIVNFLKMAFPEIQ